MENIIFVVAAIALVAGPPLWVLYFSPTALGRTQVPEVAKPPPRPKGPDDSLGIGFLFALALLVAITWITIKAFLVALAWAF